MNADLENLIVLQAQDLELARLRGELAEAPKRVKTAEAALAIAQGALDACRLKLTAEDKLRRGHDSEIATQRTKLERLRRSLDSAASSQQVAAFEHEITFAQATIARLEEDAYASLERSEALESEQASAQSALSRTQAALEGERTRSKELKSTNEATIAGVERERTELRKQIAERWLATYDRLAKAKGTAVAEAIGTTTNGKCSACQMTVRPQRWQDLIGRDHLDEIFICETCGRLMFWDPRRDTPRPWAAGERQSRCRHWSNAATSGSGIGRRRCWRRRGRRMSGWMGWCCWARRLRLNTARPGRCARIRTSRTIIQGAKVYRPLGHIY